MKTIKNTAICVISLALLMQILLITAFATDTTIRLSAESGYVGDSISISGTNDPNEFLTVKILDSDGNIVFIKAVMSEGDGTYDASFIVPDIDAGMLKIIAGSSSHVASADFTVKVSENPTNLATLTIPSAQTLTAALADKDAAISALDALVPNVTITTDPARTTSLPLVWSFTGSFDSASAATNDFTWTASLGNVTNTNSIATSGRVAVTNFTVVSSPANLATLTVPSKQTLTASVADENAAMSVLGTLVPRVAVTTDPAGATSLPLVWSFTGSFDPASAATNDFTWTASLGNVTNTNSIATSGTVSVTNFTTIKKDNNDSNNIEYAKISNSNNETRKVKVKDTENGFEINIAGNDFNTINKGGYIKIEARSIDVSLNKSAASYIGSAATSGDIVLSISDADTSTLPDETPALIGNRPVYDITLMIGSSAISDFHGMATITMPYEIANGEDPHAIVVYYINDDGKLMAVRSRYDANARRVSFKVKHFSKYVIGYKKVSFNDTSENAWYYDAVTFCAAHEITSGTGGNMFSPNDSLTRGQFIVMLMRAYGIEADNGDSDNFDDAGDTYYTGYLSSAKILGITKGVGDNMFMPGNEITRQDMFTLLYRALDILEELPESSAAASLSDFNDSDMISDYAESAIETLVSSDIISGSNGRLDPLGSSTRAQMAQVLYNLLSLN